MGERRSPVLLPLTRAALASERHPCIHGLAAPQGSDGHESHMWADVDKNKRGSGDARHVASPQ